MTHPINKSIAALALTLLVTSSAFAQLAQNSIGEKSWELLHYDVPAKILAQAELTVSDKEGDTQPHNRNKQLGAVMSKDQMVHSLYTPVNIKQGLSYDMSVFLGEYGFEHLSSQMTNDTKGSAFIIPDNICYNQNLSNSNLSASFAEDGEVYGKANINFTDTKVEAIEVIGTRLGDMNAYQIKSNVAVEYKATGGFKTKVYFTRVAWYVKDLGFVKCEIYNSENKLERSIEMDGLFASSKN